MLKVSFRTFPILCVGASWEKVYLRLLLPVNSVPEQQQKGVSPSTDFFPGEACGGADRGCLCSPDDLNKNANVLNQVETLISMMTHVLSTSERIKSLVSTKLCVRFVFIITQRYHVVFR